MRPAASNGQNRRGGRSARRGGGRAEVTVRRRRHGPGRLQPIPGLACAVCPGATERMRWGSRSASVTGSMVLVFVAECQQFEQRVER